jgi:hypothetical protein
MMTINTFNSENIERRHSRVKVNPVPKADDNDEFFKRFYYEGENDDNVIDVEYIEVAVIPEKFILRLYNASGEAVSHVLSVSKINIRA